MCISRVDKVRTGHYFERIVVLSKKAFTAAIESGFVEDSPQLINSRRRNLNRQAFEKIYDILMLSAARMAANP